MYNEKKIGLALSGGGALGAAHIGIIEEIEKAGIKIDGVSGVSAGAIVGLIYAMNGVEGLHFFFDQITGSKFFKKKEYLVIAPRKIFEFIRKLLEKNLASRDFSRSLVKFSCVVTNVATGKKEIIDSGDAVAAVIASAAYPAFMPVQKIGDNYYYDGGVTCSLPSEDMRAMSADFVVGSSIYPMREVSREQVSKMNKLAILFRTLEIFDKQLNRYEMEKCDFCFAPPVEAYGLFDFAKMVEIEKMGHDYAQKNVAALVKKLENGNRENLLLSKGRQQIN